MTTPEPMTSDAVRAVGTVTDAAGHKLTVGVDCDAVTLTVTAARLTLDAAQRIEFTTYYGHARTIAGQWARAHRSTREAADA